MEALNVGIVSVGGGGRAQIGYFNSIRGVRVTALYDPRPELLERAVKEEGLENVYSTTDHDDFLSQKSMDIISVCAPDQFHAKYCIEALASGRHVLCEKPMVITYEECDDLIAAVEKTGLVFAVQHQMRFVPLFAKIKSIVDSGEIGDLFALEADYLHDLTERASRYDPWRLDPGNYHPPLLGAGCHFVDLFRWYTGSAIEVQEVFSYANHMTFEAYPEADCVMTMMRFQDGCVGKILTSFGCKRPADHPIAVYGSKGTLVNNLLFKGHRLDRVIHEPPLPKRARLVSWLLQHVGIEYREYPYSVYEHQVGCRNSILNFIDCIRHGGKPLVDAHEGAKTVKACLAGTQSYRLGRPVVCDWA